MVVQEVVSFEIGFLAVKVTFISPFRRMSFSPLIHDGLIETSRLMFKSVLGFGTRTVTSSLNGGSSTTVLGGQINFGVGYSYEN